MSRNDGFVKRGRKKPWIGWANLSGAPPYDGVPLKELIEFQELNSILNRGGISDDSQTILLLKTVIFNLLLNDI